MPQDIKQVIQRMVDAGESDDDIQLVVEHLQQQQGSSTSSESGLPWLATGVGLAAGAGAYALTRNKGAARQVFNTLNDVRRADMLTGEAPLKSLLGNIGAAGYRSIEDLSWKPLKEMLSPTTVKDAWQTFKRGPNYASAGPSRTGITKYNLPARVMGSADEAAQRALVRAGVSPEQAAHEMLQGPVRGTIPEALQNNPAAEYAFPFQHTPQNMFTEGWESVKPENWATTGQKLALGTSIGSGYATGANTDDPRTIALASSTAAKRQLPFLAGAAWGRYNRTGSRRAAADALQGASPFSDYSLSQAVLDPLKILPKPAAIPAWHHLRAMLGLE